MRPWALFLLLLILLPLAQSLEIDLECPGTVYLNEEFSCSIEVMGGSGIYDLKFEIKDGSKTITKVLDEGSWKSGYYYLLEFIESGETKDFDAKIESEGDWKGNLKLRGDDGSESFGFEIEVEDSDEDDEEKGEGESREGGEKEEKVEKIEKFKKKPIIQEFEEREVSPITLNAIKEPATKEKAIFKKDSKYSVKEYVYISITLILLILLFFAIRDKF